MDHPRIDDDKVVDRYLARHLSAEDEALFEEHLFGCAHCLAEVQAGEALRRGLRTVAAEDAARATVARAVVAAGLAAWLRQHSAGLGALAMALLVVLSAALFWQRSQLSDLHASRIAAGFAEPVGDFLVVSLGVVRNAGGEPVEIRLDPEKQAVLLSLELQAVGANLYRVTLRDAGDEILWTGEGLEPTLYDTLIVAVPSSFLAPGSYRITVETSAGEEPAGEYMLTVLSR